MAGLEKSELDYIKALGDMETKSRSAAGSTRELENAYKELTVIEGLNIIASGGISFESELLELERMGVWGAILGKALYTGKLDLASAVRLVQKEDKA